MGFPPLLSNGVASLCCLQAAYLERCRAKISLAHLAG
jgi:hypothetical protein